MQRIANLVDLEKPCKMTIWLLSWLSIQPRTSPLKFDHFVVKSEKGSISNLSTKVIDDLDAKATVAKAEVAGSGF